MSLQCGVSGRRLLLFAGIRGRGLRQRADGHHTRANVPSRGRALALAGLYIYAGNHRGMP